MTEKNVALARRVRQRTREHPETFWMGDWLYIAEEYYEGEDDSLVVAADEVATQCGTTACFAGWAVLLSGYAMDAGGWVHQNGRELRRDGMSVHAEKMACELLGIGEYDANRLFYCTETQLDDRLADVFGERI